jgi:hypothetical protein
MSIKGSWKPLARPLPVGEGKEMDLDDQRIKEAVENTRIVRPPRQTIATFGLTSIHYYLVTEAIYSGLLEEEEETVVREGRVITQRPRVVTPYYLSQLEGFSQQASRYLDMLIKQHGQNAPGLLYAYKNEPEGLNIVADTLPSVLGKINDEIEQKSERLAAIITGEDALWDVSLLKFIYELTRNSMSQNIYQLGSRGLLDVDAGGIPVDARQKIEELFVKAAIGESDPDEIRDELERWGLFTEYQDRFFALFKKK